MPIIGTYIKWGLRNAGRYWKCKLCSAESGTDGDVVDKAAEHTSYHEYGGATKGTPAGARA